MHTYFVAQKKLLALFFPPPECSSHLCHLQCSRWCTDVDHFLQQPPCSRALQASGREHGSAAQMLSWGPEGGSEPALVSVFSAGKHRHDAHLVSLCPITSFVCVESRDGSAICWCGFQWARGWLPAGVVVLELGAGQ